MNYNWVAVRTLRAPFLKNSKCSIKLGCHFELFWWLSRSKPKVEMVASSHQNPGQCNRYSVFCP